MKQRFIYRVLIFTIAALMMLNVFCIQGFAETAVISDVSISHDEQNSKLVITGKISSGSGCEVTIVVTTPEGEIDYIDQATSGPEGSFTFEYVYDELAEGQYVIRIGGQGVETPYACTWQQGEGPIYRNQMTMTAPERVYAGSEFGVGIGISEVSPNAYGMYITLNYDPLQLEYVKTESNDDVIVVVTTLSNPGLLKIILTDLDGFSDAEELIEVTFRAKSGVSNVTSNIQITESQLGIAPKGDVIYAVPASIAVTILRLGDVSGDGDVDVGDLAMIAFYYGRTSEDPDWHLAKAADLNGDNRVDILDLAIVAQKMLNL